MKSEETKQKMRLAHLGKHHSQETKDKIRETVLYHLLDRKVAGIPPYRHTEEAKRKIRAASVGRHPSAEALAKSLATRRANKADREVDFSSGMLLFGVKSTRHATPEENERRKKHKQIAKERKMLRQRLAELAEQELAEKLRIRLFNSKGD